MSGGGRSVRGIEGQHKSSWYERWGLIIINSNV